MRQLAVPCILLTFFLSYWLPAQAPSVQSIKRLQHEVTSGPVNFEVKFNQTVTGVENSDFATNFGTVTAVRSSFARSATCGALDLTAANQRALCPGVASFPTTAFTVELWCKVDLPLAGPAVGLFSYASSTSDNDLLIGRPEDLSLFIAGAPLASTGVNVADGNWHHLAVTWESSSGNLEIFKDGNLEYSGTFQAGAQITPGGTVVLGEDQDSVGGGFDPSQALLGDLDECRVWSAVRTPAEILANIGSPLIGNELGLVIYWPMDSIQQVVSNNVIVPNGINDASFSQNNAELQNAPGSTSQAPPSDTYVVSVDPGTGLGTLGLSLPNVQSVASLSGVPLSAPFNLGERYSIVRPCEELQFDSVATLNGGYSRVADFNLDGVPDIVAGLVTTTSQGPRIYAIQVDLANGRGGFAPQAPINRNPIGTCLSAVLEVGDINRDGVPDVLLTKSTSAHSHVETLNGNGLGGFTSGANIQSIHFNSGLIPISCGGNLAGCTYDGVLADFDGDGNLDFRHWVFTWSNELIGGSSCPFIPFVILGQSGGTGFPTGTFPPLQSGIIADFRSRPAFADFDGDGNPDAVVGDAGLATLEVRFGDGMGGVQSTTTLIPQFGGREPIVGDFNEDGHPDFVVSDRDVLVYINDGSGGFSAPLVLAPLTAVELALGDFNGDGHADIASTDGPGGIGISFGNGQGGFGPFMEIPGWLQTARPDTFEVADFNQDGLDDIMVSEGQTTRVYFISGDGDLYQRNQAALSVDLDGVETNGCWPVLVTKAVGETVTWNQTGMPGIPSDSILLAGDLSARGTPGATTLAGGQVLNIDLSSGQARFLYGGVAPNFLPLAEFSLPFSATVPGLTVSLQSIAFDFTNPELFVLSQGITLDTRPAGPSSVVIPTGEDQFSEIVIPEHRGQGGTIPFYGTRYSRYFINDNGRVSFVAGSTSWLARPEEAQTGPPSIGLWTDFSSQLGTVQVTNDLIGDRETITYTNVPYWNEQVTSTFSISFDAVSGVITLDISGVNPNPLLAPGGFQADAQWLGISAGFCGATLDTPTTFSPSFSFTPLMPTDMIYDYWDGQSPGPSGTGMLQSITNLQGGMGTITFSPIFLEGQTSYVATGQ